MGLSTEDSTQKQGMVYAWGYLLKTAQNKVWCMGLSTEDSTQNKVYVWGYLLKTAQNKVWYMGLSTEDNIVSTQDIPFLCANLSSVDNPMVSRVSTIIVNSKRCFKGPCCIY